VQEDQLLATVAGLMETETPEGRTVLLTPVRQN